MINLLLVVHLLKANTSAEACKNPIDGVDSNKCEQQVSVSSCEDMIIVRLV